MPADFLLLNVDLEVLEGSYGRDPLYLATSLSFILTKDESFV